MFGALSAPPSRFCAGVQPVVILKEITHRIAARRKSGLRSIDDKAFAMVVPFSGIIHQHRKVRANCPFHSCVEPTLLCKEWSTSFEKIDPVDDSGSNVVGAETSYLGFLTRILERIVAVCALDTGISRP